MAYPPPQGPYPPYGAPRQHFSPAPGYQQPPPGSYPPQGQYPTQGQYPPPSHSPYQQNYQQPPPGQGQYPPPQQQFAPPGPPPFQHQPSFNGPPPGYQQQPPHHATGFQNAPQTHPTPPSEGYGPSNYPLIDCTFPADTLRKAMKGFGTDEKTLIGTLAQFPAAFIPNLKSTYNQRHRRDLEADIASETSSYFELGLLSILRGPLQEDVSNLNKAIKGLGTKESLLNDVLLNRSNADLRIIKHAYHTTYHRTLEADVSNDLSLKTERMFSMVLAATRQEEPAPVLPQAVDSDVRELHRATEGQVGTDQLTTCSILTNRSNGQIRGIAIAYENKYRIPLEKMIDKKFSGHMRQALAHIVRKASDPAMADAVGLEETMAGAGTKDEMLISRVVRAHWNRDHMVQVRGAYEHRYGKKLVNRVRGETSGDYMRLLTAMIE